MPTSSTVTATRAVRTTKQKLKLAVPFFNPTKSDKTKQPWEGLLMHDPGPDYDQHQNRVEVVDYMLWIAEQTGEAQKMANWRNNPVFDDDDELTPVVARKDSGVEIKDESKEGGKGVKVDKEKTFWNDAETMRAESGWGEKRKSSDSGNFCRSPWSSESPAMTL